MSLLFEDLVRQVYALVCNDDILLMSDAKPHMLQFINQLYGKKKSEMFFFMLLIVRDFGQEIDFFFGKNQINPKLLQFIKPLLRQNKN